VREYPLNHKGPFVVFAKQKTGGASLAQITISKRANEAFKGFKGLLKVNQVKIRIELSSATVANQVMKSEFLKIYRTYISVESVECIQIKKKIGK
jgi:hypothetical protein